MKRLAQAAMVVALFLIPVVVFGQFLPTPRPPVGGTGLDLSIIQFYIERIAQFLIVIGMVVAVIVIIWGGISWMLAGGDEDRLKTAKARVWNGVIGAAIVLGVGIILQTLARLLNLTFFN